MPIFRFGDMFEEGLEGNPKKVKPYICIFATTNSYINVKGELVMGRGAALQMKTLFPFSPIYFANSIQETTDRYSNYYRYGIIIEYKNRIGIFQVKYHFKSTARLDLISNSSFKLGHYAKKSPKYQFWLNFPGIGYGGLSENEVMPYLKDLPDNVVIWRK